LTLAAFAARCALTAGFLSRVERGLSSLSIVSLESVAQALGVLPTDLLGTAAPAGSTDRCRVYAAGEQWHVSIPDSRVRYVDLTGQVCDWPFEVLVNIFPKAYVHPMVKHRGEEFGYILRGELLLLVEKERRALKKGDCYFLSPETPHTYRTSPRNEAVALMISSERFVQ
jgi:transcriptional regulator with XRE-family HTH domain